MPEDVERMVPLTRTGVIFEISRALENKKSDAAISLIDFQLERGENAITIMRAAFIPTLRNLLAARLLCDAFNLKPTNFKEFTARISSLPSYAAALIPLKKTVHPMRIRFSGGAECFQIQDGTAEANFERMHEGG